MQVSTRAPEAGGTGIILRTIWYYFSRKPCLEYITKFNIISYYVQYIYFVLVKDGEYCTK